MSELKVGDVFEFKYPFYNQIIPGYECKEEQWLTPGCHKVVEEYSDWERETFWIANFEGKVIYEVLAIASMPGKYMDRVIIKYYYLSPDGSKYNNGIVKTLTTGKIESQIESKSVFPCEYEVDESYK